MWNLVALNVHEMETPPKSCRDVPWKSPPASFTTENQDPMLTTSLVEEPSESILIDPNEDRASTEGLTLSWHELTVWVKKKSDKSDWWKQHYQDQCILNKVSGITEPGQLMAIMGPSGAGKTTLLASISQRLKGDMSGKILLNGKPISRELMAKVSGFVPQQDLTLDSLTVFEHMQLMARLKLDCRLHANQRNRRILSLVTELGIAKCLYTRLSKLSGGETKRVALAVQMLTDPPLLFCDEPTTGLDSYSASAVVDILRQLAGRGKTVICSIHQPASGIFYMFHSVCLLVGGGCLAYQGNINTTAAYFGSLGLVCPATFNLAEFVVSQLAVTAEPGSQARVNKLCDQFKTNSHGRAIIKKLEAIQEPIGLHAVNSTHCQPQDEFQKYALIQVPNQWIQLYWLIWRSVIEIARNPEAQVLRLAFYMFIAVLIATPFIGFQIDQTGIQNMQGILYLVIVETVFTFSYSVFHTFPSEIPILLREIGNGLYTPGPYYISKMIILVVGLYGDITGCVDPLYINVIQLPRTLLEPILYSGFVFWVAGLYGGITGFILFCIPVIACAITATAYGCFISAVFESVDTASMVSVPIDQMGLTFCGIFMSLSNLPLYLAWVKYTSVFYYGIEAISILQWSQIDTIPCSNIKGAPCISTGDDVLQNYGYSPNNYFLDLAGLAGIYCFSHFFGFLAFVKRSKAQAAY